MYSSPGKLVCFSALNMFMMDRIAHNEKLFEKTGFQGFNEMEEMKGKWMSSPAFTCSLGCCGGVLLVGVVGYEKVGLPETETKKKKKNQFS